MILLAQAQGCQRPCDTGQRVSQRVGLWGYAKKQAVKSPAHLGCAGLVQITKRLGD